MSKASTTLAAIVVAALALTGCSGTEDGATSASPAANDQQEKAATEPAEVATDEDAMHGHPLGTRTEPLEAGETAPLGRVWDVTLVSTEQATDEPGHEYAPDDVRTPADGQERLIATFEFTHAGQPDESEAPQKYMTTAFVGASGRTYQAGFEALPEDRKHFGDIGDLYGGATDSGEEATVVPADEIDGGAWRIEYHDPAASEPLAAHFSAKPTTD